eukprot:7818217-Alexandrium_andersonii.AAC.1
MCIRDSADADLTGGPGPDRRPTPTEHEPGAGRGVRLEHGLKRQAGGECVEPRAFEYVPRRKKMCGRVPKTTAER